MKKHFPNLVKEVDMQVQEAQRVLNNMDAKRPTPRHIKIKTLNVKDKEQETGNLFEKNNKRKLP